MLTFLCKRCGALKRRQVAMQAPRCCDRETILLRKAHLEAATKLARSERATWVRLGMHVFRRPGRRWMPALTPGEVRRAKAQVATHEAKFTK